MTTSAAKKPTAREVARAYSGAASWVPCVRQMPPADEPVEVLYDDGLVVRATLTGSRRLFVPEDGVYRYCNPVFWRPV